MGEEGEQLVTLIYNKAWEEGNVPKDWKLGIIFQHTRKESEETEKTIEELPYR